MAGSAGWRPALDLVTCWLVLAVLAAPGWGRGSSPAVSGGLVQLARDGGCVSRGGADGCAWTGSGPAEPISVTVSPDGRYVYLLEAIRSHGTTSGGRLVTFARNRTSGALTRLHGRGRCLTIVRRGGCARLRGPVGGVNGLQSLAVAAGGRGAYLLGEDGLAVLRRDRRSGELRQLIGRRGCVSRKPGCAVRLHGYPAQLAAAGRSVYLLEQTPESRDLDLVALHRDRLDALSRVRGRDGCVAPSDVKGCARLHPAPYLSPNVTFALSRDGRSAYVGYTDTLGYGAVAILTRDRNGRLHQLPGRSGCLAAHHRCRRARLIEEVDNVFVSPDGRNVYAYDGYDRAILAFRRHLRTGALSVLPGSRGCLATNPAKYCTSGLPSYNGSPQQLTISPDGRSAYLLTEAVSDQPGTNKIVTLRRAHDGALSAPRACISARGENGCVQAVGLGRAQNLTLSPDGRNAYVASTEALTSFALDTASGDLIQLAGRWGCTGHAVTGACSRAALRGADVSLLDLAMSPDGGDIYLAAVAHSPDSQSSGGSLVVLRRSRERGSATQLAGDAGCLTELPIDGCARIRGLTTASADPELSIVVTPDGRSVYAGSPLGVAVFSRDPSDGALTQLPGLAGCMTPDGSDGCTAAARLPRAIAASPDGRQLYSSAPTQDNQAQAIQILDRNPTDGSLAERPERSGCLVHEYGDPRTDCEHVAALGAGPITFNPDGTRGYMFTGSAVITLARDPASGALAGLPDRDGCVEPARGSSCGAGGYGHAVLSPDGRYLYARRVFSVNPQSGTVTPLAPADLGAVIDAISPDGAYAYSSHASGAALVVFTRDIRSGALASLDAPGGCYSIYAIPHFTCTGARGVTRQQAVASELVLSPDGRFVYHLDNSALTTFARVAAEPPVNAMPIPASQSRP